MMYSAAAQVLRAPIWSSPDGRAASIYAFRTSKMQGEDCSSSNLQPDFHFKPSRPPILGTDRPFAGFNTFFHNREAQACSAGIPAARCLKPEEWGKNILERVFRYAGPVIGNGDYRFVVLASSRN